MVISTLLFALNLPMSKIKKKVVFYAVPETIEIGSGPTVRVTNFSKAFEGLGHYNIIKGNAWSKISKTINAPATELLYIESSTNRLKVVDLLCLIILRLRSDRCVVYIRDIYIELFPEEYQSIRSRITKLFNKLTNNFYTRISTQLAFPTVEMGNKFYEHNKNFKRKPIFELPPGTTVHDIFSNSSIEALTKARLKEIKIIYVGAVAYKFAGIDNYLNLVKIYKERYKFYIITKDSSIGNLLAENGLTEKDVTLKSLDTEQLRNFIYEEDITFAIHSRPRNVYDDLTYPIKVMDYISWLLPFFTDEHTPVTKLLGSNYPLYWNVDKLDDFNRLIIEYSNHEAYQYLLELLINKRNENLYSERLNKLFSSSQLLC